MSQEIKSQAIYGIIEKLELSLKKDFAVGEESGLTKNLIEGVKRAFLYAQLSKAIGKTEFQKLVFAYCSLLLEIDEFNEVSGSNLYTNLFEKKVTTLYSDMYEFKPEVITISIFDTDARDRSLEDWKDEYYNYSPVTYL